MTTPATDSSHGPDHNSEAGTMSASAPHQFIVGPPAEWKRWAILSAIFCLAVVIVPTQSAVNMTVHGASISRHNATNTSELQIDYTNEGWNSIEVRDFEIRLLDDEPLTFPGSGESINRNGTAMMIVTIPSSDCNVVNAAIQSLSLSVTVRPLGITRQVTPDLKDIAQPCDQGGAGG